MTRLVEKLQLSLVLTRNTTRFLSRVSLSTLRLCKSLLAKTIAGLFSAMDNDYLFSSEDDDHLFDVDIQSSRQNNHFNQRSTNSRGLLDENDRQKVYLVPYRWWKEAQTILADKVGGVLYEVSSNDQNADSEILLHLRKKEEYQDSDNGDEGASTCEYALVPEGMWLLALKWHNDSKAAMNDLGSSFVADEQDVFPLQIRLSVSQETNSLLVKISLEDNKVDLYKRACNLFSSLTKMLYIWDLSGQTAQFFNNDRVNLSGQPDDEVFLELHVHGFSDSRVERNDEMAGPSKINDSFCNGSVKMNGSNDNLSSYITSSNSKQRHSGNGGVSLLGLTGLRNLGNTCFMNSALQCLAHTPEIVDYFLGDYQKEINYENPLGLNGELALAFGDLIRNIWAPGGIPVAPRMFKLKLANFAPQFSGYNQHDSQEFLAFLLDGLHEDLNRVKCKPYIEAKDAEGHPEEEVAEEYWRNHRARNDSIIVDFFQGQYRSKLVCPCQKVSLTFDPLMYLSLPIPSTTMRTMIVTVLSTDGSTLPIPLTLTVPKYGRFQDLIDALSTLCSLRNDEKLLVAEIYKNKIFRVLEEPSDLLGLIRDEDKLVAYRLPKDCGTSSLIVFMHEREEKSYSFGGGLPLDWKMFGTPLVARFSDVTNGSDIRKLFLKLLDPFLMPVEDDSNYSDEVGNMANGDSVLEDVTSPRVSDTDAVSDSETGEQPHLCDDFRFYHMYSIGSTEIEMNEPLSISYYTKLLNIYVRWSERMIEKYDACPLNSLMEVCRPQLSTRMPQESVSLYKCLEAFLKEEPLGPEDMWYCPRCETHRQASKKLDLWRLPDILVIHLKRFSFSRYIKSKLETYVDFPIDDLDLTNYISRKNIQLSNRYVLYAISNHYGGMGGGHYTALVNLGHKRWFEFDDDRVYPVSEENIKTSAAYVLFYKRVSDV